MVLWFLFSLCSLMKVHHCERRGGVKLIVLRGRWVIVDVRWLKRVPNMAKRGRSVSITYETLRTAADLSDEQFQNIATLIVVKSSVFFTSSAHQRHLARDAYNASWDLSRRSQVHSISLILKALPRFHFGDAELCFKFLNIISVFMIDSVVAYATIYPNVAYATFLKFPYLPEAERLL